eukprot:1369667-Pyramimonas_sp.AAC.1
MSRVETLWASSLDQTTPLTAALPLPLADIPTVPEPKRVSEPELLTTERSPKPGEFTTFLDTSSAFV